MQSRLQQEVTSFLQQTRQIRLSASTQVFQQRRVSSSSLLIHRAMWLTGLCVARMLIRSWRRVFQRTRMHRSHAFRTEQVTGHMQLLHLVLQTARRQVTSKVILLQQEQLLSSLSLISLLRQLRSFSTSFAATRHTTDRSTSSFTTQVMQQSALQVGQSESTLQMQQM